MDSDQSRIIKNLALYDATTLDDMILVGRLKKLFHALFKMNKHSIDSMFFVGNPGLGKSTLARLISEHFDWDEVRRFQLTDSDWFSDAGRLDARKIMNLIQSITSSGKGLSKFWTDSNSRSLFIIDEFQVLDDNQQRMLNAAIEEQKDDVCIIATSNMDSNSTVASNTLSRFDVIDFDVMTSEDDRDALIDEMVRVSRRYFASSGAKQNLLSENEIREIAANRYSDFRQFFRMLRNRYIAASNDLENSS